MTEQVPKIAENFCALSTGNTLVRRFLSHNYPRIRVPGRMNDGVSIVKVHIALGIGTARPLSLTGPNVTDFNAFDRVYWVGTC